MTPITTSPSFAICLIACYAYPISVLASGAYIRAEIVAAQFMAVFAVSTCFFEFCRARATALRSVAAHGVLLRSRRFHVIGIDTAAVRACGATLACGRIVAKVIQFQSVWNRAFVVFVNDAVRLARVGNARVTAAVYRKAAQPAAGNGIDGNPAHDQFNGSRKGNPADILSLRHFSHCIDNFKQFQNGVTA